MSSILQGYEYDIFISYRQKDNKHDGWVTEFVSQLKGELESTFKEDISVYFDINPHDGLLETHDVDASLKEKLKCLVFIPVISRTYCDPKSFAWEYEFKVFLDQASHDRFGLKVRLTNGNVATRILPVQINDIHPEDKSLLITELGGVLRAIEFIYKEPGVNRPLRSNEDNPNENLNKTFYRNQINKVANAIDEIIHSLKDREPIYDGRKLLSDMTDSSIKEDNRTVLTGTIISNKGLRKWLIISLLVLLGVGAVYTFSKVVNHRIQLQRLTKLDKSIAVLPFANDSPDKENEYFCNGIMDEILDKLQKIGDLRVKSRTSVEKYRNGDIDINEIGRELGVSLIMQGSVRKVDNDLRIAVYLTDAKTGDNLWSEIFQGKYTIDILEFQSSLAKKVASSLNIVLAPQEEISLDNKQTTEILAYDLCTKGNEMINQWRFTFDSLKLKLALNLYNQALEIDPIYIDALAGKSVVYSETGKFDSALFYLEKIERIDPGNVLSIAGKGMIYLYSSQPDSALKYYQKAIDHSPNIPWHYLGMGQTLIYLKNELTEGLSYYQKACDLGGISEPEITLHIAIGFFHIGDYQKALKYLNYALSQKQECKLFLMYDYLMFAQGKFDMALNYLDSTCSINACEESCNIMKFYILTTKKEFAEAERIYKKALDGGYKRGGTEDIFIACVYNETGRRREAFTILKNSIKHDEFSIENSTQTYNTDIRLRLAAAYSIMGENKKALKYLPGSGIFELLGVDLNKWQIDIKTFPGFDNLRNDPAFKAILKQIEDEKASLRTQVMEMEKRGELHL